MAKELIKKTAGVSGNSVAGKSFQIFTVSEELLQKVVEAVQAGEKEARSSGNVQSFEVFCHGFRQNISLGRIMVVPAKVCSDRKSFPTALLHGALIRIFGWGGEEIADLVEKKIGDSEFDEYSQADFDSLKESIFRDVRTGEEASLVVFAPNWMNSREYICFHFTKDAEELKNDLRHQVFSAYYNPSVSSAFNALMTNVDTTKVDVTDVTPKLSYPFLTENPLKQFPQLEKQAGWKKETILLNRKTADAVTKQTLDPQELDVFDSLNQALENSMLPEADGAQGEGGFTAPEAHPGVPREAASKQAAEGGELPFVEVLTSMGWSDQGNPGEWMKDDPRLFVMTYPDGYRVYLDGNELAEGDNPEELHRIIEQAAEVGIDSLKPPQRYASKEACAPHETPFTNVGPGTEAHAEQEASAPAMKESVQEDEGKEDEESGSPIGIAIDEQGVPRRKEEETKTAAAKCDTCGHSKEDHHSDRGYGACWHGSGKGNRCGCKKYKAAKTAAEAHNPSNRKHDSAHPETQRVDPTRLSSAVSAAYNGGFVDKHNMPPQKVKDYLSDKMGNNNEYAPHAAADHAKQIEAGAYGDDPLNRRSNEKWGSAEVPVFKRSNKEVMASYIADVVAAEIDEPSEAISTKGKQARAKKESLLDRFRPKTAVELDIDSIWDAITEDMGPAPLVDVDTDPSNPAPSNTEGESQSTPGDAKEEPRSGARPNKRDVEDLPKAFRSPEPEDEKSLSDSEADAQEDSMPHADAKQSGWNIDSKYADFVDDVAGEIEDEEELPRMGCDQCEMMQINGVPCHETGCPNMGARWDAENGAWVKQRECFECGMEVDEDDPCCSAPVMDEAEEARFGSKKEATGEMSQSEADDPRAWPLHHAIAEALGGTVKAFDQYQGPYVLIGSEVRGEGVYAPATPMKGTVRLWIQFDEGGIATVYNEDNEKLSEPFSWNDTQGAIEAAKSVLDQPKSASAKTAMPPRPGRDVKAGRDEVETRAEQIMVLENQVWDKLGIGSGGELRENPELYARYTTEMLAALKDAGIRRVSKAVLNYLTNENYHSLVKLITDTAARSKGAVRKKADTADNEYDIDAATNPTSKETGPSDTVECHKDTDAERSKGTDRPKPEKGADIKQAGGTKRVYEDAMIQNEQLLNSIKHGDSVTILVPAGIGRGGQEWKERSGKAVMRSAEGGWVLNMGGPHGTPGLANERNIVRVKKGKPAPGQERLGSEKRADTADNPANEKGGEGAIGVKTEKEISDTQGKTPKYDVTGSAKKADTADNPYNMEDDGKAAPENKKVVEKKDTTGPTPDNTKSANQNKGIKQMVGEKHDHGIEGDIAQAKSESTSPDAVDKDIPQPTVSVLDAGKRKNSAKVADLDDEAPSWIDRHSITCAYCGELADEREATRLPEGELCARCAKEHPELVPQEVEEEFFADAPNDPLGYAERVRELEAEGMTTSDAQAVADAEFQKRGADKTAAVWMNEYDIDDAIRTLGDDPVLGKAVRFLAEFRDEVNSHSDGWAYWRAPAAAAGQLMALIQAGMDIKRGRGGIEPQQITDKSIAKAMGPIKSFMTRRGLAAGMQMPKLAADISGDMGEAKSELDYDKAGIADEPMAECTVCAEEAGGRKNSAMKQTVGPKHDGGIEGDIAEAEAGVDFDKAQIAGESRAEDTVNPSHFAGEGDKTACGESQPESVEFDWGAGDLADIVLVEEEEEK